MRLGLEMDEANERKRDRELGRERDQLGLEALRGQMADQDREREYKAERQSFLRENLMEPVLTEDNAGNLTPSGYRPRSLTDADMLRIHEGVGALDYKHGRLDPEKAMAMQRALKVARDEGAFDAYNEFLKTGDPKAAEAVFNAKGRVRIVPGSIQAVEKVNDDGLKYRVLSAKKVDGGDLTFDPVAVGIAVGGVKSFVADLERSRKAKLEERKVGVSEAQARTQEAREENRYQAGERRADQRDRQLDILSARLNQGDRDKPLTTAQKMKNMSIDAARKFVAGLTPEDIKRRTAKFSATGRENPDFDPQLAKRMSLANSRKYGDDPDFDESSASQPQALPKEPSVENRFHADPAMKGRKLGKKTDRGVEVLDASGKLIGFYN
jgi:hypothetical protein